MFNTQKINVDFELFKKLCNFVLEKEKRDGTLNIIFVGMNEMSKYNLYRGKEEPTDVLSFEGEMPNFLGEIYICPQYVQENAEYFGVQFQEELIRVCVHGILHLLGYDHEKDEEEAKKMFEVQERYVADFSSLLDKSS